jgi:predicted Zn-dependent peptidase
MFSRVSVRLTAALSAAALAVAALGAASAPELKFTDTKLKNGLRVIIHEDHTAPVFSIAVVYNAGSRDERQGRTGFAHLFEHMMFKGSENVGPGEHFVLVFNNGGSMNGTTNEDRTLYYETLPANQLDLGLFLEADRMRSLEITKDNLDNQRNAVQEERRQGLDNQPYGKSFEAFQELANDSFAYKHSVIGSMADLNAASVEDVASFFKTYYAPNNAVIGISGDVNTADTLAKVRKYFEPIPAQPAPAAVVVDEKPQTAERRAVLEDPLARLSRLDIGYKIAGLGSKDDEALSVLGTVLSSGRSSRLYEAIVRQKQLSSGVGAGAAQLRGTGHFRFNATLLPGKARARCGACSARRSMRSSTRRARASIPSSAYLRRGVNAERVGTRRRCTRMPPTRSTSYPAPSTSRACAGCRSWNARVRAPSCSGASWCVDTGGERQSAGPTVASDGSSRIGKDPTWRRSSNACTG